MAPKTKATKVPTPPPSSSAAGSAAQDPMLQGTYMHNDVDDFESPSHDLDQFDERLVGGTAAHSPQPGARSGTAAAGSGAKAVALHKQMKSDGTGPKRPPMRSSFDAAAAGGVGTGGGHAHRGSVTEEEADAQEQRRQDIDDVRNLDARFGGPAGSDDDSD